MPPKVKKGVLRDEQIQPTVNVVKQYWPDYQISPTSIRNPSRAFVIKLYTDCVQNLDEILAFATRTQLSPHPPGLGEEEVLFLKLSRIPSLAEADFRLGDLYAFDPIRVNSHILIIMHFLMFSESIMDKTVQICNAVFDAKEKLEKNEEELEQLKQDKLQKQIQFTQVKAEKKKLKEEAAVIAPEYEATMTLVKESENKCKSKITEIDKLKFELENIQQEVRKLEKTQTHLTSQIVTEEEYTSLINSLESLEKEEKKLEEIDLDNGLFEQKQYKENLDKCLRELNHLELSEDIFKLYNYRVQLQNEEESLQYASTLQKNSESEIKTMKLQLENEKQAVDMEKRELQEQLRIITEEGLVAKNKLKKQYQQMSNNNQIKIKERQRILEKRQADYKKLQMGLKENYMAICEKQDMAIQSFKAFMDKVNKALKDRHVA